MTTTTLEAPALSADWREAETGVPLERAGEAFEGLAALIKRYPRVLTNPIGLRTTGADTASLSPCYGRANWWFALFYRCGPFAEFLSRLAMSRLTSSMRTTSSRRSAWLQTRPWSGTMSCMLVTKW